MIKRPSSFRKESRDGMRGGNGSVSFDHLWEPKSELKSSTRLFCKLSLKPGDSIGLHPHDAEEEIYLVLKGQAEADDNGEKAILNPGDTMLTGSGASHSIKSLGPDTLEVLAVIVPFSK